MIAKLIRPLVLLPFVAAFAPEAFAQAPIDTALMDKARPFLEAENIRATPAIIDATLACVMAVIGELPSELKAEMLAQTDFEDALDVAVRARPEVERPLEMCF